MEFINVIVAALGAFVFGALWYTVLAKQWMAASGVEVIDGKPANQADPKPYIAALITAIMMAGMMRHIFEASNVVGIWGGAIAGLGIGLFLAVPWLITCYGFAGRPMRLMIIDGGYATFASMFAGIILTAF